MPTELDVEVEMCNLGDAIERKGISEGVGLGTFETTVKYYMKGRITAEEAAFDLNMPLNEFLEKIKEGNQQPQA